MNKFIIYCGCFLSVIFGLLAIWALSSFKMHDFKDKCLNCHINIPDKDNNPAQDLLFADEIDRLCRGCHTMNEQKSHPIKIMLNQDIPLKAHLDKNGLMTCTTCHDVHKEDKTTNKSELSGLLWGHLKGKAFCSLCHSKEALGSTWRHQTAITYAHPLGKLIEDTSGSLLDKFSTDCLSCHDGTISKFPQVQIKQGVWQHGIGISHPVGIDYPRSQDFTYPESLPKEIRLFAGRVGCLSCHEIYSEKQNMLAMDNRKSGLCLACHKK